MAFTPAVSGGSYPQPSNFSYGSQGATSQLTTVTMYDLKPQELTQIIERNKNGVGWRMLLKLMGFTRGVSAPTTGHYEIGRNIETVSFGQVITPSTGAGTNVVLELEASQMYTSAASTGNVLGSWPIVGDVIELKDSDLSQVYVTAKNTAVNPHQITVRPIDQTVDLAGLITLGEDYRVTFNLSGEGTDLPSGRTTQVIKYTNTFGIVKSAVKTSGSNLTTQPYFDPIPGVAGSFYLRDAEFMSERHEEWCDNLLLRGKQADNITVTSTELDLTVPVSSTEGMLTFIENYGWEDIILPGLQSIQTFDDVSNTFKLERVHSNDYLVLQGYESYQNYENVFADYAQNFVEPGFIIQSESEDGVEEIKINVAAYGIRKSGFNYKFKDMNAFNDGKSAGVSGYPYLNYAVFVPADYTVEKQSNTMVPTVGYEYKMLNGYSRENFVAQIDGTTYPSPLTTTTVDIMNTGIVSEIASHCTAPNNCLIQKTV